MVKGSNVPANKAFDFMLFLLNDQVVNNEILSF